MLDKNCFIHGYHLVRQSFPSPSPSYKFIGDKIGHCHPAIGVRQSKVQNVFVQNYVSSCNLILDASTQFSDDSVTREIVLIQKILKLNGPEQESAINQCGLVVSEDLVLNVLWRHRSEWKPALLFFNWISTQQGSSYGSRVSNEMLDILGRTKQIELMQKVFDETPKHKVDERTFAILLNRYAAAHKVTKMIEIFYKRIDCGLELDTVAFQTLLMSLCRYKHVEEAEALFLQKQIEFPPVIKSWNIILNGWCVLGSFREAKRFWKDIIASGCKLDLFTYGTFINALTKAGKLTTAVKLFDSMWERGCCPDVAIYNCIIDALCFKKKIPEALRIFCEMGERGCLPNVATYNSLIKHICKNRRMEKAYELLDEMSQKGFQPNVITFTYFLKAAKNIGEVSTLLKMMKRTGCEIDIDTYNLILNLYLHWNHHQGIQFLWTEMERNGLGPDGRSYTVMIHGLYRKGRLEDSLQYFFEMQSKGMIPEPRTMLLVNEIELKRGECKNVEDG